jgi:hypothetical protein
MYSYITVAFCRKLCGYCTYSTKFENFVAIHADESRLWCIQNKKHLLKMLELRILMQLLSLVVMWPTMKINGNYSMQSNHCYAVFGPDDQ